MNRNWALALKLDASKLEFAAKARFVNRLKEPGTKGTMHLECRVYDIASNCIGFLRYRKLTGGLNPRFDFLGDLGVLGGSLRISTETRELPLDLLEGAGEAGESLPFLGDDFLGRTLDKLLVA